MRSYTRQKRPLQGAFRSLISASLGSTIATDLPQSESAVAGVHAVDFHDIPADHLRGLHISGKQLVDIDPIRASFCLLQDVITPA